MSSLSVLLAFFFFSKSILYTGTGYVDTSPVKFVIFFRGGK